MKFLGHLKISLFLGISIFVARGIEATYYCPRPEKDRVLSQAYKVAQKASRTCLEIMNVLDDNLLYWKKYITSSSANNHQANRTYDRLFQEWQYTAHYLGAFKAIGGILCSTQDNARKAAATALLFQVTKAFIRRKVIPPTMSLLIPFCNNLTVAAPLSLKSINHYRTKALKKISYYKAPCRFIRHWPYYVGISLATVGVIACCIHFKKDLGEFLNKTGSLWEANVTNPIKDFWDMLHETPPPNPKIVPFEEQIAETRQNYKNAIAQHLQPLIEVPQESQSWTNYIFPSLEEEKNREAQRQKIIEEKAEYATKTVTLTPEISKKIHDQGVDFSTVVFSRKQVVSLLILQAKQYLLLGSEYLEQLVPIVDYHHRFIVNGQKVLRIAALFSIIPAALTLYKGYEIFTKKHTPYFPEMQQLIVNIEQVLIKNLSTPDELNFTDQGFIIFWAHKIKAQIQQLVRPEQQQNLRDDLHAITRSDYTAIQRKAVIEKMYRSYLFLAPQA